MSATISECGLYRYTLGRLASPVGHGAVLFVGVNPSTADAETDDATVRKWRGFASRWGYHRFMVGNLFAFRATDVRELAKADDPIGPDNDSHLDAMIGTADLVVPCWGNRGKLPPRLWDRMVEVRMMLRDIASPVRVLGLTANTQDPKHPLMLGYATPLQDWTP